MERGKRETITSLFSNITASSAKQPFLRSDVIQDDYDNMNTNTRQRYESKSKIESADNAIYSAKNTLVDCIIEECNIYTPECNDPSLQTFIASPSAMNSDFLCAQYGSVKLCKSVPPSTPIIIDNQINATCNDILVTDTNIIEFDRINSKTGTAQNPISPAIDVNLVETVECVVDECFVEIEDLSFRTCIKSPPDMTSYSDTFLVDYDCKDASASPGLSKSIIIEKVTNTKCLIDHSYATSVVKATTCQRIIVKLSNKQQCITC